MSEHNMVIETDRYERQYGYSYHYRIVCSCGHESQWSALSGNDQAKAHREAVILDALGLSFNILSRS